MWKLFFIVGLLGLVGCWDSLDKADLGSKNQYDSQGSDYHPPILTEPETITAYDTTVRISVQFYATAWHGVAMYSLDANCDGSIDDSSSSGFFSWSLQKDCTGYLVVVRDRIGLSDTVYQKIIKAPPSNHSPYALALKAIDWDSFDLKTGRGLLRVKVSAKDSDTIWNAPDCYTNVTPLSGGGSITETSCNKSFLYNDNRALSYTLIGKSDSSMNRSGILPKDSIISLAVDASSAQILVLDVRDSGNLHAALTDTLQIPPAPAPCTKFGARSFMDSRDSSSYRCVVIGKLAWMAENLHANHDSLYAWEEAQTACPANWRVPNTADFDSLITTAKKLGVVADVLRADSSWGKYREGSDLLGFAALASGFQVNSLDTLRGEATRFWTSKIIGGEPQYFQLLYVYGQGAIGNTPGQNPSTGRLSDRYSLRCVQ